MKTSLGRVIILVEDYDQAFDFYAKNFFCKKLYDGIAPGGGRYLHIGFSEDEKQGIWFLQAGETQQNLIGHQTGGQPTLVIYTDEVEQLYNHLLSNDVTIINELVNTNNSKFFHCLDLYGNRITVVELPSEE